MNNERCPDCSGEVRPTNRKGDIWPYKDDPTLEITVDCILPQCTACGEGYLDQALTDVLGAALRASYRDKHRREP